ncbi:hypothetical protein F8388_004274 [Cannabis sativa]|uniref:Uncharacterized protein n=1 Tax=Cannabis sativa TaxID=3483 RepID=A0A7J6FA24_CANSA|nr:hypothetical protein F8388_004274 [Cannabis sativa]
MAKRKKVMSNPLAVKSSRKDFLQFLMELCENQNTEEAPITTIRNQRLAYGYVRWRNRHYNIHSGMGNGRDVEESSVLI